MITIMILFGDFTLLGYIHRPGYNAFKFIGYKCWCLVFYEQGNLVLLGKLVKESKRETSTIGLRPKR